MVMDRLSVTYGGVDGTNYTFDGGAFV